MRCYICFVSYYSLISLALLIWSLTRFTKYWMEIVTIKIGLKRQEFTFVFTERRKEIFSPSVLIDPMQIYMSLILKKIPSESICRV